MRDLANQNFYSQNQNFSQMSGPKSRGKILIPRSVINIIAVLTAVLIILFIIRALISSNGIIGASNITLRDAPKGLTPVNTGTSDVNQDSAINLTIESATFTNVSEEGISASANATRRYGDGSYSLTVDANLPDPAGQKYQIWLIVDGVPFDAGFMNRSGGGWHLTFNDVDNYSAYNEIWLTREITTEFNTPEVHILEGTF